MRRPSLDEMRKHVATFAESHEIIVHYEVHRPISAFSVREAWEIDISPVKSEVSYATALHELGHLLGRFQESGSVMVRERWAWRWAERNALFWTPLMARQRDESLEWYVPRAKALNIKRLREAKQWPQTATAELRAAYEAAGLEFIEEKSGRVRLKRKGFAS